jgi:hypothetical protein
MPTHSSQHFIKIMLVAVLSILSMPALFAASRVKYYSFEGSPNGANPSSSLVQDAAGNFYGTTTTGGVNECFDNMYTCGTVFELSKNSHGAWTEQVIYSFSGRSDGYFPSGLAIDASGNLYGVSDASLYAAIFELSPTQNGWVEKTIYSFPGGALGAIPSGTSLVFDPHGNLYGVTSSGGICEQNVCGGVVFELTPSQNGAWTEDVLYSFPLSYYGSGPRPVAITFDSKGNLYGTTTYGGVFNWGNVYELTPNQNGSWNEVDLYDFQDGFDGGELLAGVTFDNSGNIFGEASTGGSFACPGSGCGTLFELTPNLDGTWTEMTIHTFNGLDGAKGEVPAEGLAFDGQDFYGTAGGGSDGYGIIFEFSAASPTTSFHILGSFDGTDGAGGYGSWLLVRGATIFGASSYGGDPNCDSSGENGCGTVFEVTP